ncbi:F-box/LRR-repeat protein At3g48880-like [Cornus florida]|uniref:F-box/LRR-repeat protein At3g48880-like n=1 Tax=Cornus florida TaxID=4283 RepID=UPI002899650A|nr:F-box/LRR-repeat protein At3g48880-like [Cornus florida]
MSRLSNEYRLKKLDETELIKFVVSRSNRCIVSLVLSNNCSEEAITYVAQGCPALKYLELRNDSRANYLKSWSYSRTCSSALMSLVCKWHDLEVIKFGGIGFIEKTLTQISLHCKNFVGLTIFLACITKEEALAIVTLLPGIKHLELRNAIIAPENLVMILRGCKKLVHFDVRDGVRFRVDNEILKLAAHIPTFKYEGSRLGSI